MDSYFDHLVTSHTISAHMPVADNKAYAATMSLGDGRFIATTTDGIGTKLLLATKYYDYINLGRDLVASVCNDILCTGAMPKQFLDYIAIGKFDYNIVNNLVLGINAALAETDCKLVAGETAEMQGCYPAGGFDLAGFCVGIGKDEDKLGPYKVESGMKIIGLPSSGFHCNGYTVIRQWLLESKGPLPYLNLLHPTRLYIRDILKAKTVIKSLAHVTGGGISRALSRLLPDNLQAHLDMSKFKVASSSKWALSCGMSYEDQLSVFNCGYGMLAVVEDVPTNIECVLLGEVE